MAVTFQRERAEACFTEIKPLLEAHWTEIAHWHDILLDPEWSMYAAADDLGNLRVYTLRDDGELCGYAIFFVRANVHYRSSLQAVQDILFLRSDYRKGMLGVRFIKWCDEQLANEGVQVVSHHVKLAHDFGPVLVRLGYEAVETIYSRRLDRS